MTESFPRQQARTRGFRLGVPRAFQVSPDGTRVVFLRSKAGDDPVTCLWEADSATGAERLVADPRALGADEENLPPEERARRERVRETAAGIVAYATDKAMTLAVFALSGQVYAVPLGTAHEAEPGGAGQAPAARLVPAKVPALDPRPDPAGRVVAYVHDGALRVIDLATGRDQAVAQQEGVTFGLAEFVAAEEMGRSRGYWWSPDGSQLLIARVDESAVARWHIADPANPGKAPVEVGYPAAGTANADVSLLVATAATTEDARELAGNVLSVVQAAPARLAEQPGWDRAAFPYLVSAAWGNDLLLVVQTRDQRTMRVLNGLTGQLLREDADENWTDVIEGVPAQLDSGDIVWTAVVDDTRRLVVAPAAALAAAEPVTPAGLQVRAVLATDGDHVLFAGSTESTELGIWRYGPDGLSEVATEPGVHGAAAAGGTTVIASRTLASTKPAFRIVRDGAVTAAIASLGQEPNLPAPAPLLLEAGPAGIRTAVLLPSWHQPGTKLPVLMDPYGGPGAQRVIKAASMYLTSQWFAEQGFAVVVADGRGTPGRTPSWERTIAGDFASGLLEDQITALSAAAVKFADLDTTRVAIRGWSFGGYLSALAVLRRPDVFHAAVAGAPPTDWRLYDTHYTERYLGDPGQNPEVYQASSLIDDPARAVKSVIRPLLIIHGLADDNVFVAHSLRLSSALLAAGYPHSVLPLSGITHMTSQETVAENMLLFQVAFLKQALSSPAAAG
ncbi:MAG TPA: prolyl oligopeptidase family serine peptidase [Trebonia sp.]|nr:prolyl oligopeptidase family serine peptidase [Trebonia sp.]